MSDLWLSDEEIYGKEPTLEEQGLQSEIKKLKKRIINNEELIEVQEDTLERIYDIIKAAIVANIHKTRGVGSTTLVKSYREALLVLRDVEKHLIEYYKFKEK